MPAIFHMVSPKKSPLAHNPKPSLEQHTMRSGSSASLKMRGWYSDSSAGGRRGARGNVALAARGFKAPLMRSAVSRALVLRGCWLVSLRAMSAALSPGGEVLLLWSQRRASLSKPCSFKPLPARRGYGTGDRRGPAKDTDVKKCEEKGCLGGGRGVALL